jgi:membrane-associated phospholipid phosphatase
LIPDWLQRLDESIFLAVNGFLHRHGGDAARYALKFHDQLGNAFAAVLILGTALVLDPRFGRWIRRVIVVVLALVAVSLVGVQLKRALPRPRPLDALSEAFARGEASTAFGESATISSFPSGHAATAFALAAVLAVWARAIPAGWRRCVARASLFVAATLTGLARIYAGMHFPLDVVGGALLGILAGWGAASLIRIPTPEVRP